MADPFPQEVVDQAWNSAGGKCERCGKRLNYSSRGKETDLGWEAHHRDRSKASTKSNCEILCQDCHKGTHSYGQPR